MMYSREEINQAIEAAEQNIKTAKEQIKRMDKMLAIQNEINESNCFGCIKPGIFDHYWSAHEQTARIYACSVEKHGNATCLMAKAYLLRAPENESVIAAIDGGILKEVSIGCALRKATCTICGKPYGSCEHRKGKEYDGDICYAELSEATDAYEFSFVAVPAQRAAGIVKGANVAGEPEIATAPAEPRNDSAEGASGTPHVADPIKGAEAPDKTMSTEEAERARARLRLENLRFGG